MSFSYDLKEFLKTDSSNRVCYLPKKKKKTSFNHELIHLLSINVGKQRALLWDLGYDLKHQTLQLLRFSEE